MFNKPEQSDNENYLELFLIFHDSWSTFTQKKKAILAKVKYLTQELLQKINDKNIRDTNSQIKEIDNNLFELSQLQKKYPLKSEILLSKNLFNGEIKILHEKIAQPLIYAAFSLNEGILTRQIHDIRSILDEPLLLKDKVKKFSFTFFSTLKKFIEFISLLDSKLTNFKSQIETYVMSIKKEEIVNLILKESIPKEEWDKINEINSYKKGDYNILWIDDENSILEWGKEVLSDYKLECVDSGIEGLDRIRKNLPDLILLDVNMPGMSGIDFLNNLKSDVQFSSSKLPIIMISTLADEDIVKECLSLNAKYYITKPIKKNKLLEAVSAFLPNN
ncbi:MAG: response regulator [Spirochaetota bacterium]|nr:response regulator [Spirochaetota bacterium]